MQLADETLTKETFDYPAYYEKVSGFKEADLPHHLERLQYKQKNSLKDFFRDILIACSEVVDNSFWTKLLYVQNFFLPVVSEKFFPNIALFTNRDKYDRDLQTAIKPGKAIKFIFPSLTPQEIEHWVDKYKETYYPQNFVVEVRDGQEDFKRIYEADAAPNQNPTFGKNLSTSCMRGSFDELSYHPSEAFASGDFEIAAVWLGDQLAARTVIAKENKTYAPIYTVSNPAYIFMNEHLTTLGCKQGDNGDWRGLKLLRLEESSGTCVGPYLDLSACGLEKTDKFFVIDQGSVATFNQYGVTGGLLCCRCENTMDEDSAYSFEDGLYCQDCYNEYVYHCDHCDEDCREVSTVNVLDRRDRPREEFWCSHCQEQGAVYCEHYNEYWGEDFVTEIVDTDNYFPTHLIEDSSAYVLCDMNGGLYEVSATRKYINADEEEGRASLEALLEINEYTEVEDGSFVHNDVLNKDQLKLFNEEEAA